MCSACQYSLNFSAAEALQKNSLILFQSGGLTTTTKLFQKAQISASTSTYQNFSGFATKNEIENRLEDFHGQPQLLIAFTFQDPITIVLLLFDRDLRDLRLQDFKELGYLPSEQSMRRLKLLEALEIHNCPKLKERLAQQSGPNCERSKISHIPLVRIDGENFKITP